MMYFFKAVVSIVFVTCLVGVPLTTITYIWIGEPVYLKLSLTMVVLFLATKEIGRFVTHMVDE